MIEDITDLIEPEFIYEYKDSANIQLAPDWTPVLRNGREVRMGTQGGQVTLTLMRRPYREGEAPG